MDESDKQDFRILKKDLGNLKTILGTPVYEFDEGVCYHVFGKTAIIYSDGKRIRIAGGGKVGIGYVVLQLKHTQIQLEKI